MTGTIRGITALLVLAIAGQASPESFVLGVRVDLQTGSHPTGVCLGDVTGDGRPDVVVANSGDNSVSILRGTGAGGFDAKSDLATGTTPIAVALGDLDGDGLLDIVTANVAVNTIAIIRSLGGGSFTPPTFFPAGASPAAVATADFDQDGRCDIVCANAGSNTISVWRGDGAGGLQARSDIPVGAAPNGVATGNLTSDGRPDIAVANEGSNTVSILAAGPGGSFGPRTDYVVALAPHAVALGDVNGDLQLDVVVAAKTSSAVSVLLALGPNAFTPAANYTTDARPLSVAIGDVTGDGHPDLVTANALAGTTSVLAGDGTGNFESRADFATGSSPMGAAIADLDADGRLDIGITNFNPNTVSVLFGNRGGMFSINQDYAAYGTPTGVAIGDLNTDGRPDMAVSLWSPSEMSTFLADGTGGFARSGPYPGVHGGSSVAIADLNRDGHPDVVVPNELFDDVDDPVGFQSLFFGDGAGGFPTSYDLPSDARPTIAVVGDVIGDTEPDIVYAVDWSNDIRIHRNYPFGMGSAIDAAVMCNCSPVGIAIGDVNKDGLNDVGTANGVDPTVSVRLRTAISNVWGPLGKYTVGGYPWAVAIADLSGDGKADLVASNDGPWVSVLLGDGAGGFAARTDYGSRGGAQSLAVADYDADGRPDVALTGPDSVQILLGDGRGGLGPAFLHASGTGPVSVATADLDADGRLDLATANYNSGSVSVLRGRIPTVVSLNVNVATVPLGAVVLLLADVSITPPATGTATSLIRFFDGFTLLGEAPLGNGHAELMINMQHLGDRPLTAVYVGDDRRFGSISPVRIVHVVDPALIDVPSSTGPIALALEGVRPNPSPAGRITVSLALPNDAPARLELVDVRGRIVATREVGTLGAGSHTIALTPQRRPAPGVYFVRLCQGEVRRAMRVALL